VHARTGVDLFLPVVRNVVDEAADQGVGLQARRWQRIVEDLRLPDATLLSEVKVLTTARSSPAKRPVGAYHQNMRRISAGHPRGYT
jgi:hypothetical protein